MSSLALQYPLVVSIPLTMGACAALSVLLFSVILLTLYLKSTTELTMLHRVYGCMRVLVVTQTAFTLAAVALLSAALATSSSVSATFSSFIAQRQAANTLKASGAALVAGYSFFATEHQLFRWVALLGGVIMAGVDAVDMLDIGQMIGIIQKGRSLYADGDDWARIVVLRALKTQYAAKIFSLFSWLLMMQIIGCLMNALGWFELNELPEDEEVAGHLKELARATINRRIQEKRNPDSVDGGVGRRLFKPTDKLEVTWDQMVDHLIGPEDRVSYPISTNPLGQIPLEVQKELRQALLKMGVKQSQIYEILDSDDEA